MEAIAGGAGNQDRWGREGPPRSGGDGWRSGGARGARFGAAGRRGEVDQQDQPKPAHGNAVADGGATERSVGHAGRADESSSGFLRGGGSRSRRGNSSGRLWIVAPRFGVSWSHCDVAELCAEAIVVRVLLCIAARGGSRRHTGRPHEQLAGGGTDSREDRLGRAREDAFGIC